MNKKIKYPIKIIPAVCKILMRVVNPGIAATDRIASVRIAPVERFSIFFIRKYKFLKLTKLLKMPNYTKLHGSYIALKLYVFKGSLLVNFKAL
jgi:hypothetical protein